MGLFSRNEHKVTIEVKTDTALIDLHKLIDDLRSLGRKLDDELARKERGHG